MRAIQDCLIFLENKRGLMKSMQWKWLENVKNVWKNASGNKKKPKDPIRGKEVNSRPVATIRDHIITEKKEKSTRPEAGRRKKVTFDGLKTVEHINPDSVEAVEAYSVEAVEAYDVHHERIEALSSPTRREYRNAKVQDYYNHSRAEADYVTAGSKTFDQNPLSYSFSPCPKNQKENPTSFGFLVDRQNKITSFDKESALLFNKSQRGRQKGKSLKEGLEENGITSLLAGASVTAVKHIRDERWITNGHAIGHAISHQQDISLELKIPNLDRKIRVNNLQKDCAHTKAFAKQLIEAQKALREGKRR